MNAITIYTAAGDTIVLTKDTDGNLELLVFDGKAGVEIRLDDRAIEELREAFEELT